MDNQRSFFIIYSLSFIEFKKIQRMNTPTSLKTILLLLFALTITNCKKDKCSELILDVDQDQLAQDIADIDEYIESIQDEIDANGWEVVEHPSGLRYIIKRSGSGERPNRCDAVAVTYEGRLMSTGEAFDATSSIQSFGLENTITGWQIGVPLVKEGGRITLFIPSVYAYGESGQPRGGIPPNENLRFEVILFQVQ